MMLCFLATERTMGDHEMEKSNTYTATEFY